MKLLEYLYSLERKLVNLGYDLEGFGYSYEVQKEIDNLAKQETVKAIA